MRNNFIDDDIEILDWGEEEELNSVEYKEEKKPPKRVEEKNPEEVKKELISWVKLVIVAVLAAIVIDHVLIVNANVPSGSMENTIMTNSRMIGWRWSYAFSNEPERGDIIIFEFPDDKSKNYVKRVIALPGERVRIEEGIVYVNDQKLDEDYVVFKDKNNNKVKRDESGDFEEVVVPKDSYFVLGDNRNNSWDSRYWTTTNFVPKKNILGKALFTYWYKGVELKKL